MSADIESYAYLLLVHCEFLALMEELAGWAARRWIFSESFFFSLTMSFVDVYFGCTPVAYHGLHHALLILCFTSVVGPYAVGDA